MAEKLKIVVGGMVGQFPLGGVAWDYFHYVLGLAELGHDVVYHEDTWVWPYDPVKGYPTDDPGYTTRFIGDFFEKFGARFNSKNAGERAGGGGKVRWHYVLLHEKHFGMSGEEFDAFAAEADLFLNVSGACFIPDKLNSKAVKAWMDTDPGYNQIRMATKPAWAENIERWLEQVKAHDVHLTYAENIYGSDCLLPRLDYKWITTRPMVTLADWAEVRQQKLPTTAPYTTVMSWDYFPGKLELNGVEYHGKPPEYERFCKLPERLPGVAMSLAVGGHKTPTEKIKADGWGLIDARAATHTADSYRDFIAQSRGEWSVAKNVFVHTRSGWFSCRTCCYLAAGKPAVVQDTGWSKYVPSGAGVFAFETMEEAVMGIKKIESDYAKQSAAAYDIAREYLAPDKVLTKLLADLSLV